jgi:hypothetical protein
MICTSRKKKALFLMLGIIHYILSSDSLSIVNDILILSPIRLFLIQSLRILNNICVTFVMIFNGLLSCTCIETTGAAGKNTCHLCM